MVVPTPTARPWIAATRMRVLLAMARRNRCTGASSPAGRLATKSARSLPAQKPGPAPERRTTVVPSVSAWIRASAIAAYIATVMALRLAARFIRIWVICPWVSVTMSCVLMAAIPCFWRGG